MTKKIKIKTIALPTTKLKCRNAEMILRLVFSFLSNLSPTKPRFKVYHYN